MKHSYHVHSNFSDGKSTINEILASSQKLKLDEVGLSDHFTITPRNDHFPGAITSIDELDRYILEISSLKDKYPLKLGLEADFFPETVDVLKDVFKTRPFDYIIGSVHISDLLIKALKKLKIEGFNIDISIEKIPLESAEAILQNYWKLICAMAESSVFDIVGHIDLPKKFGAHFKADCSKEIKLALEAIADHKMCVELNTSGWHYPCREQFPSLDLLKKCQRLNIPVVVTADAHLAENLCRDFNRAFMLLSEIGYSQQPSFTSRKKSFHPFPKN